MELKQACELKDKEEISDMDKEFIISKKIRERLDCERLEGQVASEEVIKMLEDIIESLKKEKTYKDWMNWFSKLDKEVD